MSSESNEGPVGPSLTPSPDSSNPSISASPSPNPEPTASATAVETSTTTPHLRRTQTDPNLRSCFICLQTPAETPHAVWVNACPCTLEAHEDCMLSWIAEHERENTKALRCPACKGKIKTTEPADHFVTLRDRLHKVYSRVTPAILLGIITGGSMAASSYLGMISLCVFAGPGPAMQWLGAGRALADRRLNPEIPLYRWRVGMVVIMRFWMLNFIAPALLIHKALPHQLTDFLTLPASLFYGISLVLRDEMPTWPPSPAWVMTMLPWVTFSYNRLYRDLFGAYETRLNIALRGRGPPPEEPVGGEGNNGGPQIDRAADNHRQRVVEEEGYLAQALRVGNAMLNLLPDDDELVADEAEIELEIGPEEDEQAIIEQLQQELGEIAGQRVVVVDEDEQGQEAPPPVIPPNDGANDGAAPPPVIRIHRRPADEQQPPNPNQAVNADDPNNVLAPEEPIREARAPSTTLNDIVNGVVSALTFPVVCWGAGEVLRHTLPTAWVTRPPPGRIATGLLQEQWGRSLVGGAVFIVARDILNLYTKHRRVKVRKQRRVRNVPRRQGKAHGSTGTSTPGT